MGKTVFLFSGQGSQHFQMARALWQHEPRFRAELLRLDAMVRDLAGTSVVAALYDDANDKASAFDALELTHPAIFMVEYALAQTLIDAGIQPDLCLGASLGSFAAAAVAGCIEVEHALGAVIQQAAALEACCEAGGMLAVLADTETFAQQGLHELGELAAVNFAAHFVVSAPRDNLAEIEARLKAARIAWQRLPVGFAFHSHWIDPAQAPFASFTAALPLRRGALSLACCDQAAVLQELPTDFFWQVVRRPIRFGATVEMLEQTQAFEYIDLGPAGTLATFLRYLLPAQRKASIHAVLSPFGDDRTRLAALLAEWPRRRRA